MTGCLLATCPKLFKFLGRWLPGMAQVSCYVWVRWTWPFCPLKPPAFVLFSKPQGSPLSPAMKDVEFSETWISELPGVDLRTTSWTHPAVGQFPPLAHSSITASDNNAFAGIASCVLPSSVTPQPLAMSLWPLAGFGNPDVALKQEPLHRGEQEAFKTIQEE